MNNDIIWNTGLNMSENKERNRIRNQIQNWLLEEGFKVKSRTSKGLSFNFAAENNVGVTVNVMQLINKADEVRIAAGAIIPEEHQKKLLTMSADERNRILWDLRFGLLNIGVGFKFTSMPPKRIEVFHPVYYDGLTKDRFMQRLSEVKKALVFIFWTIARELGEPTPNTKQEYVG